MPSRHAPLVLLATLLLLLAGCGGGSSAKKISDPRAEALSYLPADAVATVEITTSPDSPQIKSGLGLVRGFPFGSVLLTAVESKLDDSGVNFERDIKPMLGNPVAIAALDPGSADGGFVAAFVTKDAGKLEKLIKSGGVSAGKHGDFTLYRDRTGSDVAGLNGSVFVLSNSQQHTEAAIDRHASKQGVQIADVQALTQGLPAEVLMRVSGNVRDVIARRSSAQAGRVPFVRALKGYAATFTTSSSGALALDVRMDTSAAALAADERPLAEGDSSPPLPSGDAVDVGAQDVAHAARFLIAIGQATDPSGYARFKAGLDRLKTRTGVDVLKELSTQFSGPAQLASNLHSVAVRATAKNPATLRRDLVKLTPLIESTAHGRAAPGPNGLTVLRGGTPIAFGVIGDQFVAGTVAPAALARFAASPGTALPGAKGTVAVRVGLKQILSPLLAFIAGQGTQGQLAQGVLDRLGDVTGYASEDAGAITAHFELGTR